MSVFRLTLINVVNLSFGEWLAKLSHPLFPLFFAHHSEALNIGKMLEIKFDRSSISCFQSAMKPFIELSFMPETLASGGKTVFSYEGNIKSPKDYEQWSNLMHK